MTTAADSCRTMRLRDCLDEVTQGIGKGWPGRPLYGATRAGLAPAKEAIGKSPERYKPVEPGTVFYNPMRILLGSIALADEDDPPGITSPDYVVLRPRPGVLHPRVFYHWLRSDWGEHLIKSLARGAVRERILFNRLAEGTISVPPWPVQERMAAALSAVGDARRAARERVAAADALPAAYLREVFDGPAAADWPTAPLAELCDGTGQYGTSQRSNRDGRGLPVLGMPHIHEGRIRWERVSHVDLEPGEMEKYRLRPGDILFNRTNSAELVGKSAVFDGQREAVFASYLVRFRLRPEAADPDFVTAYINSHHGRAYVERHMARAVGQVNISASTMQRMPVPCPPVAEQRRVAAELAGRLAGAGAVAAACRAERDAVEALPAAYLRAAFPADAEPVE